MAASFFAQVPGRVRAGITFIELMTVVGIIATLAGLLLPIISWSRMRAQQTACTSNLAQLGAATLVYATSEGGRLPASQNWGAGRPERSSAWFIQLPKFMAEKRISRPGTIFQCPSFTGVQPGLIRNEVAKSYKMNVELDRVRGTGRGYRHKPFFINQISDADNVVMFFDGITTGGKGQWGYGGKDEIDDSRHPGWIGLLMSDGRVVRAAPTADVRNATNSVRWISRDWQ